MNVDEKMYGVLIRVYRMDFRGGDCEILYHTKELSFHITTKYDWYFRLRCATYQCKYPRRYVELVKYSYELNPEQKRVFVANKLKAAKAKLTIWQGKVANYKKNWNSLFPIEDDLAYKKALNKISAQKNRITELSDELNNMCIE